jgi:hypothetical protein
MWRKQDHALDKLIMLFHYSKLCSENQLRSLISTVKLFVYFVCIREALFQTSIRIHG